MKSTKKVGVIGSGFAGLAAAIYLQKKGIPTLLFESHYRPGGCASFYKRGKYIFDAGATTLSGTGQDRPIGKLLSLAGISPRMFTADPGIVVHHPRGQVILTRDWSLMTSSLRQTFSDDKVSSFWTKLKKIENKAYPLLESLPPFPPRSLTDYAAILTRPALWKAIPMLPALFRSFTGNLSPSTDLEKFLDELLLISLQNTAGASPLLTGALGTLYPTDMVMPEGGIGNLASQLVQAYQSLGGSMHYKTPIEKIYNHNGKWELYSKTEKSFVCDRLILTGTIWDTPKLFDNPESQREHNWFQKQANRQEAVWSAFTLNFAATGKFPQGCYHQVHITEGLPNGGHSIFISFSHPDDTLRAPPGQRTVSISTHTLPHHWQNLSGDQLEKRRTNLGEAIWRAFSRTFPEVEIVKFRHSGTPRTFEHFTGRYMGSVGGIPHQKGRLHKLPSPRTPFRGLYQAGDTVFPGQGIVSVVHSGFTAARLAL